MNTQQKIRHIAKELKYLIDNDNDAMRFILEEMGFLVPDTEDLEDELRQALSDLDDSRRDVSELEDDIEILNREIEALQEEAAGEDN
jgi:polyhydroxyalkanoate synthesis regulator phasin